LTITAGETSKTSAATSSDNSIQLLPETPVADKMSDKSDILTEARVGGFDLHRAYATLIEVFLVRYLKQQDPNLP
jgi:hypothetical protein